MKTLNYFILIITTILLACSTPKQDNSLSYLHTEGKDIVNESGKKIYLKGVGLGNWLLPEGYMWKFGDEVDRPRKIEKLVSELIGPAKANKFWFAFRQN